MQIERIGSCAPMFGTGRPSIGTAPVQVPKDLDQRQRGDQSKIAGTSGRAVGLRFVFAPQRMQVDLLRANQRRRSRGISILRRP